MPGLLGDQVRMTESPELTPYLEPLAEGQARAAFLTQEAWGSAQGWHYHPGSVSPWLGCHTGKGQSQDPMLWLGLLFPL